MEEYDLVRSIDRGLDPFGPNTKQLIYWKMLVNHNATQQDLVSDPQALEQTIEELSGASALRIERSIIREIRKTFNISAEEAKTMVTAIEAAKEQVIYC